MAFKVSPSRGACDCDISVRSRYLNLSQQIASILFSGSLKNSGISSHSFLRSLNATKKQRNENTLCCPTTPSKKQVLIFCIFLQVWELVGPFSGTLVQGSGTVFWAPWGQFCGRGCSKNAKKTTMTMYLINCLAT